MVKTLPSSVSGVGLMPGCEARSHMPCRQTIQQKQWCNKFSRDFKNGPHHSLDGRGVWGRMLSFSLSVLSDSW